LVTLPAESDGDTRDDTGGDDSDDLDDGGDVGALNLAANS
jgi:hypothetical protein